MSEKASVIHHQTGTGTKMNGRDILFLKWRSESHYAAIGKHGTVMPDLAIFKYPKCQFLYRTPNLRKKCTFKIYLQAASRLRLPNCKSCLTARSPNWLHHSHSCLEEVRMRATLNSVSQEMLGQSWVAWSGISLPVEQSPGTAAVVCWIMSPRRCQHLHPMMWLYRAKGYLQIWLSWIFPDAKLFWIFHMRSE